MLGSKRERHLPKSILCNSVWSSIVFFPTLSPPNAPSSYILPALRDRLRAGTRGSHFKRLTARDSQRPSCFPDNKPPFFMVHLCTFVLKWPHLNHIDESYRLVIVFCLTIPSSAVSDVFRQAVTDAVFHLHSPGG